MKILSGQHLLMIGDSITDAGRVRQIQGGASEGFANQLGDGYAHIVCGLLNAVYPERLIRVTNAGNSGDNVRALKERWQRDCLDCAPDWVSILIGVNDVWSRFASPQNPVCYVPPAEYEKTLRELVATSLPRLSGGMILMTPYLIENTRSDAMRIQMEEYGIIVKHLAEEYGLLLVDTQAAFDRFLRYRYSGNLALDRVHPNLIGATIIAKALLEVLEFDYDHVPKLTE